MTLILMNRNKGLVVAAGVLVLVVMVMANFY